jgi:hypothetical protein
MDVYTIASPLAGVPLERVRVWAWRDPGWEQIPFQFDRRTADGDWDFGLHASPGAGRRNLTADDELVMATSDLGDRAPPAARPPGAVDSRAVGDPGHGHAYVAVHRQSPAPSPRRYVTYDRLRHRVVLSAYSLGFDPERPLVLNELVWSADPQARDWIDTSKVRTTGKVLGRLPFARHQGDFHSEITGVIEGPVRLVVRTMNRLRMVLGLRSPRGRIDQIHTSTTFLMEVLIELPFNVGWLFQDLAIRSTLDLLPGPRRTFTSPGQPAAAIDGHSGSQEAALGGHRMQGFTIAAEEGETVHGNLWLDPQLRLDARLYYRDDGAVADPPEGHPGQHGETGVTLTGWERLHRGRYRMRLVLHFLPRAGE